MPTGSSTFREVGRPEAGLSYHSTLLFPEFKRYPTVRFACGLPDRALLTIIRCHRLLVLRQQHVLVPHAPQRVGNVVGRMAGHNGNGRALLRRPHAEPVGVRIESLHRLLLIRW